MRQLKKHQKVYYSFFEVDTEDITVWQPSEIDDRQKGIDIHHIICRGMGGNPLEDKDIIENLMLLTVKEHEMYGDIVEFIPFLLKIHKHRLKATGKKFNEAWIDEQIGIYEAKASLKC